MTTAVEIPIEIAKRFAEQADYADSLGISFGGLAGTSQMLKDCHAIRDLIPKPKPVAPPVDTLIEVNGYKRYSAGYFNDEGELGFFCSGATSKTQEGIFYASNWSIAEDNDKC